jgi:hypothetical protein
LLVNLPNPHPGAPTCPSTPKVLRTREHASTPSPSPSVVFTFKLIVHPSRSLGVRQTNSNEEEENTESTTLKSIMGSNDVSKTLIKTSFVQYV